MTSFGYIIVDSCIISFNLNCIMQLKQFCNIATEVSSRKKGYYFWWSTGLISVWVGGYMTQESNFYQARYFRTDPWVAFAVFPRYHCTQFVLLCLVADRSILTMLITVTSHERHGVSNHPWFNSFFNNLFNLTRKASNVRTITSPGPRLNIKTVLSTYGDFHVKDKTAVRTSYL